MMRLLALSLLLFPKSFSEMVHGFTTNDDSELNSTWKENLGLSSRHRIKDSSYLLDRYPIGELSPDVSTCRRPAKCISLYKGTCMGTKIPYSFTTLDLIPERVTPEIVEVDIRIRMSYISCVSNILFFFLLMKLGMIFKNTQACTRKQVSPSIKEINLFCKWPKISRI